MDTLDSNDELLQDFLVEAGELLDALGEQLMSLEQAPDDKDLLNALFRSFHTIKGGAGFMGLGPLVDVCHRTEDVFNGLRSDKLAVNAALMDTVLVAVDAVTSMFDALRSGQPLEPADPDLLAALEAVNAGEVGSTPAAPAVPAAAAPSTPAAPPSSSMPAPAMSPTADDEITEDEFERLLDELQGIAPGVAAPATAAPAAEAVVPETAAAPQTAAAPAEAAPTAAAPAPSASTAATKPAAKAAPAAAAKQSPPADTTLRVDTSRLDALMNLIGELVLVRNRLVALRVRSGGEVAEQAIYSLDLITSELQSAVMKLRMQPIRKVFGRFPRVARDVARTLGKEVELQLEGEETELDKNLVEVLADPLVHLVRNAVDHGVESPDEREALGKPRVGHVLLSAAQEGNAIVITIEDDGKGMDPDVLRRKAVEKGLYSADAAHRLSDTEAWDLIFMAGFSTCAKVSDVSGRGVGMDVVRTAIARLNGNITIESKVGVGTRLEIRLRLTLAIFPTLLVKVSERRYALPLAGVRELLELDNCRTRRVEGREVVMLRDETMPLHWLSDWFAPDRPRIDSHHAVVVDLGAGDLVALVVDELLGQEDVVIKPLGSVLEGLPGFAGATITGDGSIALILDARSLVARHGEPTTAPAREAS